MLPIQHAGPFMAREPCLLERMGEAVETLRQRACSGFHLLLQSYGGGATVEVVGRQAEGQGWAEAETDNGLGGRG